MLERKSIKRKGEKHYVYSLDEYINDGICITPVALYRLKKKTEEEECITTDKFNVTKTNQAWINISGINYMHYKSLLSLGCIIDLNTERTIDSVRFRLVEITLSIAPYIANIDSEEELSEMLYTS